MYIHKHYNNVRVHEISDQATSKPLHYQYKTTPSYTLVSGHSAGMENLNLSLSGLLILLQVLRRLKVLINYCYRWLEC